jgi:hypothetical protein
MRNAARVLTVGLLLVLLPALGWAQTMTDRSEMDQWMKMTEHQTEPPVGTTVTMANWQQYQSVMPLGMIKFFQGVYGWKMPADVQMPVGTPRFDNVPKTWMAATEKYSSQVRMEVTPAGHHILRNYYGGTPFPNPQDPDKGWKILANVMWGVGPAMYVNTPEHHGTVWSVDRFGNISPSTFDVVSRLTDYITDPGFPHTLDYAPGTWATGWAMQESPEQAKYTVSLGMIFKDQEKNPFPDTYVFVPALRRSLRLSSRSRCSPVFGLDWAYDDAAGQGFAGGTSLYTGDYLGDRKIITLTDFTQDGAEFPGGYDMPIAWPKPSWGKWVVRPMVINDVHRIPSEAPGYCYSSRIMYVDKELWHGMWVDLYDANRKLWKVISYYNDFHDHPPLGRTIDGVASVAYDLQNTHMTVWCGYANAGKSFPYIDNEAPKEYMNGVKYGSPAGLSQILR